MLNRITNPTFLLLIVAFGAVAQAAKPVPGITPLKSVAPNPTVLGEASRDDPLVIRSVEAARKFFMRDQLRRLNAQVDFDEQFVLVFAWRGSGQDRLNYDVLESFPEQIVFSYQPGRTRDLRPHFYVFALRSNVTWKVAGKRNGDGAAKEREYIRVEVKGRLSTGVVAIGGETTGATISSGDVSWELDFAGKPELRRKAQGLDGKIVTVKGRLSVKRGVEIGRRWIVRVESLN